MVSDRSGCSPTELAVLGALDAANAGRPQAYVRSARVLAELDERIGLGPRYAAELLFDLARPWLTPVPLVAAGGNYGDRSFPLPPDPEFSQCRPSHAGQLVLDAAAGRRPPVPVGLINGTVSRGGTRPPLEPFAVLAALRRLLDDPGVPDRELLRIAGGPWSGTGCTVTGDLAALARGRQVTLRETGRITVTGTPVPPAGPAAPASDGPLRFRSRAGSGESFPAHLVIESLPARTFAADVAQRIAGRSSPGHDELPDRARRRRLPVHQVADQSGGTEVRIVLELRPGADPAAVRDQLATIRGVSVETPVAFPAPLASLLRSWVASHRDEDPAAGLTALDQAIRRDQQREQRYWSRELRQADA